MSALPCTVEIDDDTLRFTDTVGGVRALLRDMQGARRVALDIESNGMFAYEPCICTVQLAWLGTDGCTHVAIVDTLACPVRELAELLEDPSTMKVIHDLAFDARILHLEGVDLRSVRDTSIAASYLCKPGTGLATLLANELDVHVGKEMQNSDWARRPLSEESLAYLAGDVSHLLTLDTLLGREVVEAGIADEVATETAYRLVDALQTEADLRAPHLRIKGNERLDAVGRQVLRSIAGFREALAKEANLPPQRILGDKLLIAIANRRPRSMRDLLKFRATKRLQEPEREALLGSIRDALSKGPATTPPPPAPARPAQAVLATRKAIEKRLQAWRKAEAERRQVSEQVVLPTHCLRRLVQSRWESVEAIQAMPGFGPSRAERYAERLAALVRDQQP